jgi:predicted DNA-binding transcriptional regulator AlpA
MKKVKSNMNNPTNSYPEPKNKEKSLLTKKKSDQQQYDSNLMDTSQNSYLINPVNLESEMKDKTKALFQERLISFPELRAIHGLSRVTTWRLEGEGKHPKRRQIGKNSVRWLLSEVLAFINELPVVETRDNG